MVEWLAIEIVAKKSWVRIPDDANQLKKDENEE